MAKDSLTDEERFELEKQKQARLAKFKMDKHHKIERFGVTVASIVFCMLILTVCVFIKYRKDMKAKVGDTPIYTKAFATSLTHHNGTVENIYRNEKGDKVAILVKFDDMSGMKTDAKNYQAWVTGWDAYYDDKLSGSIYVYGKSGYMALVFYSPTGFSNQVVDIIVRSNESIVDAYVSETTPKDDTSFSKYDQFRMYANLGAKKMNVGSFFDTEDGSLIDSRKMYDEAVLLPQVKTTKDECNAHLKNMEIALRRMDFYEEALDKQGIQILDRDPLIKGDSVVAYTDAIADEHESKIVDDGKVVTGQVVGTNGQGEDVVTDEKSTVNYQQVESATETAVDENGQPVYDTSTTEVVDTATANTASEGDAVDMSDYDGLWKLQTGKNFDGGLDLDWQSYDIFDTENHFLDKLRGDNETYAYMNLMHDAIINSKDEGYIAPEKWVKKDGSEFNYNTGDVYKKEGDDEIQNNIDLLTSAYRTYYDTKREYQLEVLPKFLDYEFEESNFAVKTSINAEADCIQVWHKIKK